MAARHTPAVVPQLPDKRSCQAPPPCAPTAGRCPTTFLTWSWTRPCTVAEQRCRPDTQAPCSFPGTARASELCRPTGTWASEMPQSAHWSWVGRPVLGDIFWAGMFPLLAGNELASVAAALLDDHVLMVADDDFSLLVVEHGEGTHPDRGAGEAGHLVGLVELQQTL